MKKWFVVFIGIVLLAVFAAGCGGKTATNESNSTDEQNTGAKDTYTIKLAYVVPETQSTHIAAKEVFKKYVEEKSNGRIKVELHPNGELGGDRQAIEAVQLGTIQMTIPAAAVLSGFEPKFQVFDLPYLFKSKEAAYKALDGELGKKLSDLLIPLGLRNLAYGENGFRNITNNKGPINSPADLKGVKIRTMENPVHMATFKALGANPTPISFGELYTALQQGTVDAEENPIPLVYTSKFYEVQKYYTLDGHVYAATAVLINNDFFNSLPEDLQQIIVEGAEKYKDEQRKLSSQQDTEMLRALKDKGMQINELTPEQKQEFIDATLPVYDQFKDVLGEDLINLAKQANN
ncbi:tripartite ATP-independent transporter solute receptor, DctP family [Desulfotomaculum arcticum]|uniref:Tripartite ATP-independent transporter solute receptor, DctP family n=1 Tax=Desulfotruncus arcticus DSM 17038 TaxID=1121424 RepID=A0A1I2P8Q6_9FIRM|nr:DctP family TRAP transporter solute-binding subunit [Desulfotruncus arcticus]SFG12525.1 tripartite ATP-independent transporter solute receptor, DctP family [Desulfotomaculum arcticum] [Desulfotruncus arcticus DSM 17038]